MHDVRKGKRCLGVVTTLNFALDQGGGGGRPDKAQLRDTREAAGPGPHLGPPAQKQREDGTSSTSRPQPGASSGLGCSCQNQQFWMQRRPLTTRQGDREATSLTSGWRTLPQASEPAPGRTSAQIPGYQHLHRPTRCECVKKGGRATKCCWAQEGHGRDLPAGGCHSTGAVTCSTGLATHTLYTGIGRVTLKLISLLI